MQKRTAQFAAVTVISATVLYKQQDLDLCLRDETRVEKNGKQDKIDTAAEILNIHCVHTEKD